jgi:catechol 2,3-dioxygenase-like lactoylglutathione lyase family enzyme
MDVKQIHHFALVVDDVDASATWYREVLGFALERRFGFPEAGVEIAHVASRSGVRIELIQQSGSVAGPDVGLDAFGALRTRGAKHVGLLVDDIEAAAGELRGRGIEFVHEITTVEPAGVRNFWIRDNSGNLIEVNQWL